MTANNNGSNGHGLGMDHGNGLGSNEGNFLEENRRVLGWVAELLNGNSRETALMELSKKREQVPELALIIWHSFGRNLSFGNTIHSSLTSFPRRYDLPASGDNIGLSPPQPIAAHSCSLKSSLQRTCSPAMCCIA